MNYSSISFCLLMFSLLIVLPILFILPFLLQDKYFYNSKYSNNPYRFPRNFQEYVPVYVSFCNQKDRRVERNDKNDICDQILFEMNKIILVAILVALVSAGSNNK